MLENKVMDVETAKIEHLTTTTEAPPPIIKRRLAWLSSIRNPATELKITRILLGAVCISTAALVVSLLLHAKSNANGNWSKLCLTEYCVTSAARIIVKLDRKYDPCENFYNFACGTFIEELQLPDDKSYLTPLSYASDILSEKLRSLVQELPPNEERKSAKIIKDFYESCMDLDRIDKEGVTPLTNILEELGGWPVVEGSSWNEDKFSLLETLYKIRRMGFSTNFLFSLNVIVDMKNSSWRIIGFEQAELGMPSREYMMKGIEDKDVQAYLQYQINLAEELGADSERAKSELTENLLLEIEIANYTLPEAERRDIEKLYNKMTLKELEEKIPTLPWTKITNEFVGMDMKIDENEPTIVNVPSFMENIAQLIERTSKRKMSNYLLWHVAATAAPYLSENLRNIEFKYTKAISGVTTKSPRWKDCMDLVSDELSYAVGSLYVRNFFNVKSKEEAEEMVGYIHKIFNDNLKAINWMDKTTRKQALIKSNAIKPLIGYPSEILNETVLMDYYKGMHISDGELLSNMANVTIYKRNLENSKLRDPVKKSDWKIYGDAAVVNAFYSPFDNAILFPAGILQGIFFDANRPKYLNYGSIGFVIGHEITHGFDDEGSQFNENGDLQNWWEHETRQKFLAKSQCIVNQYSNYTVPEVGLNLNGAVTQGENIADNGGMKGAYNAYNKWTEDHGEEKMLPGLPYSPRQLFWISAAHLWCSKERIEYLKLSILSKQHSLPRFRINGPMSNLEEFSRDWSCPLGSFMNPEEKCSVW